MKTKEFFQKVSENATFVLEFAAIIVAIFVVALVLEKLANRKNQTESKVLTTQKITAIGMFSALAMILHIYDFPLFFVPGFYKMDFSEIPVLIGSFAYGPAAGVIIEAIKILLKLLIKSTSTAFVGDLANFVVGCSFVVPASAIYAFNKTKKTAIIGCVTGTLIMAIFGSAFNGIYLLPAFSKLFHMEMADILAAGQAVNPFATGKSITNFVIACVAPMNLLKGGAVSIVTLLVYKRISRILKNR